MLAHVGTHGALLNNAAVGSQVATQDLETTIGGVGVINRAYNLAIGCGLLGNPFTHGSVAGQGIQI